VYSEDEANILDRMIGNVPSDVDASEGTFVYDALSPTSLEIAQQEAHLDEALKKVFAQSAAENGYSDELEQRAAEFGITRKAGTKATVTIRVTGTDGTYNGVTVQTAAGLQYMADITVTNGIGTAVATAADVGTSYNVVEGTINQFPVQVSGLTSVTNTTAATGGTDVEIDDALLARLLVKVQTPSTSGNKNDYKLWALSISGIGGVRIFPLWNGNGTVKVCLIDSNKQPASDNLVQAVKTYTESVRPIGATVTYEAATGLSINIIATILKNSAYTADQITSNIKAKITAYLQGIAFVQNYVSFAQIGNAVLSSEGVTDYNGLTVNGGDSNILVGDEQVPVLGAVTLN
jgi:uncharacterized phage protein gp47/JayE